MVIGNNLSVMKDDHSQTKAFDDKYPLIIMFLTIRNIKIATNTRKINNFTGNLNITKINLS